MPAEEYSVQIGDISKSWDTLPPVSRNTSYETLHYYEVADWSFEDEWTEQDCWNAIEANMAMLQYLHTRGPLVEGRHGESPYPYPNPFHEGEEEHSS